MVDLKIIVLYFVVEKGIGRFRMPSDQACDQLGTPGGARSFLRGGRIF